MGFAELAITSLKANRSLRTSNRKKYKVPTKSASYEAFVPSETLKLRLILAEKTRKRRWWIDIVSWSFLTGSISLLLYYIL